MTHRRSRARGLVMLAVGHVTHDRVPGPALVPGGAAWYAARAWAGLGARARLVTTVGEDFTADAALAGISTRVRRGERTTCFENAQGPDGARRQRVSAVAPPVRPGRLPLRWRRADGLLLAPVIGEVDPGQWLRAVRARVTGVALQGWLRRLEAPDANGDRAVRNDPMGVETSIFRGVAVAVLSEEDLAGEEAWLAALTAVVPRVVLTRGAAGCDLLSGGRREHLPTRPVAVVDATGAGDTFAAALLLALVRGADLRAAAAWANAAAGVAVAHAGAPPRAAWEGLRRAPH